MKDSRDFKKEYEAFLKKVPYQTAVVDGVEVRYQYGGKDGAPVILFFNGLEMQEMWMPYAEKLENNYKFPIEQNRCAMACQGCGAVLFLLKKQWNYFP